jgi:RNA-directed DNA polymerase
LSVKLLSPRAKVKLLNQQNGQCCGSQFRDSEIMETHHLFLKKDSGKDEYQNIVLIHKHCLDPLHGNVFLERLLTLNMGGTV